MQRTGSMWRRFVRQTPRGQSYRQWLIAGTLLVGLSAALPVVGSEGCLIDEGEPDLMILDLDLPGQDVAVKLLSIGLEKIPITVSLEDEDGDVLMTQVIPGGDEKISRPEVVFEGALAEALTRGLSYRVTAEDPLGAALMEPYPFFLQLDCAAGGSCAFQPILGFESEALVVTPELAAALANLPQCQLEANLMYLARTQPKLRSAIQTLQYQLSQLSDLALGPTMCTYAWQAVVAPMQTYWNEHHTTYPNPDEPNLELMGVDSGAAECFGQQARAQPWYPSVEEVFEISGSSVLGLSTICISGTASCGSCPGTVSFAAELSVCAASDAAGICKLGSAVGYAEGSLDYEVESNSNFDPIEVRSITTATASYSSSGPEEDWDHMLLEAADNSTFMAPATASLNASTYLYNEVEGVAFQQSSCNTKDGSSAYSFAETNILYDLVGIGSSSCARDPIVKVQLMIPTAGPVSRFEGGIKLKRWRDPPGGGN